MMALYLPFFSLLTNNNNQTDHTIQARASDSVIVNKENNVCQKGVIVVPLDNREKMKESEKVKINWMLPENCSYGIKML